MSEAEASARIIDGKGFAAAMREKMAVQVAALKAEHGLTPGLGVVIVGDDPGSQVYVRNKAKQSRDVGMNFTERRFGAEASGDEVLAAVHELNDDPAVHGFLVQLPLPGGMDEARISHAIDPEKDADGFHIVNVGRLSVGLEAPLPCTPHGCMMLLRDVLGELKGLKALVVGRSNIVGKPMAQLLLREHCTVTIAHSRTKDLAAECRNADILIAAVGQPEMVRGDWIKPGATVIDVGMNRVPAAEEGKTRLVGDVCFAEAVQVAGAITPVPGGVGPMTIACLIYNTLAAACRQAGAPVPEI